MIYIGIDISKYKHDCFIATETNSRQFSFENNLSGFNLLLKEFKPFSKKDMIIGFEATGHYGDNLKAFLSNHGYSFMEINPFLVKKFSDSKSLRKTKTDKKDSKLIAEYMMTVDYKAYHHQSYHINALKSLTRLRSKLISFRTSQYNIITKTLDIIFPEFKPFMREQGYGETSLYLLSKFKTPKAISKMTNKHYDHIRELSRGRFSYPKFTKLKNLAKNSIGTTSDYLLFQLSNSISYVTKLNKDIKEAESKINEIMNNYPTYFQSIPGMGAITVAIILAEYGDISLFNNPAQMTSYAGIESSIKQSGTMTTTGKLVKRGSKFLRAALINTTLTVMRYEPTFYSYYDKKKQEGKPHRVAQVHLAKKLIRIIFHLEKNKTYFDSKLLK